MRLTETRNTRIEVIEVFYLKEIYICILLRFSVIGKRRKTGRNMKKKRKKERKRTKKEKNDEKSRKKCKNEERKK